MNETVVVAIVSLCGTLGGSFLGVMRANELVDFRLKQLEAKVEKHNNLVERLTAAEVRIEELSARAG